MTKETVKFSTRVRLQSQEPGTLQPPRLFTPTITVSGQTAFMRECLECGLMAPHKLVEGGSECGVCGKFTARFVPSQVNP